MGASILNDDFVSTRMVVEKLGHVINLGADRDIARLCVRVLLELGDGYCRKGSHGSGVEEDEGRWLREGDKGCKKKNVAGWNERKVIMARPTADMSQH